jgi:SAM-dependent methyltransferase
MRGIVDGNGILVSPGDVGALTDAIVDLLTDPERRRQLGARSLELFNERYSVDRMVDDAVGLYRRLLAPTSEVPELPPGRRPIGIDLSPVASCPRCHGPVTTAAAVVTADGLVKQGVVVCERCDATVGLVDHFTWNFHEQGPRPEATTTPRVVPALGEHRLDADAVSTRDARGWFRHERFLVAGVGADALRFDVRATDVTLRFLRHRHSGIVELLVDGELVGEVDLFLPDGALVSAYPVVVDAPFRRHSIEIRPTGRRHPSAAGQQVLLEEVVLLGPRQRGLAFDLPEPLNRGNPMSPRVLRYLDQVPVDAWVLECGGGDRRGDRPGHVNFEFLPFELADALGDIHHLPFREGAFDLVFSQAVFEHVRNPFEAAAELIRVTRPGGFILTEVAFLQPLHAVPYHFFNMSQWGAEELFSSCEIVESDWFGDLSDSVDWFFRSANLDSDAPPKLLAKVRRRLKELDRHIDHDDLKPVAAGVFVAARKP